MQYYIQHSAKGEEQWVTHQMAYDTCNDAVDVYEAVYRDDKYLDYRIVDERFVIKSNGVVFTAPE